MRFSIIIPTYNRIDKLKACLKALADQEYDKKQFEVIVVDDGSCDNTARVLKRMKSQYPVPLKLLFQKNCGQGVARNTGVEQTEGEITLLIGDDIIATSQLLREHDRIHKLHPEQNAAVLGFITWHPKLKLTPLMKFMERGKAFSGRFGGHQFAYDLLEGREKADFRFFYTSNISLKTGLLKRFKFDPWFSGYGWEDIELGWRLTEKAGMILYYAADAIAYHDHPMTMETFQARMFSIGESIHKIHKKYPRLGLFPSERKQAFFRFVSSPFGLTVFRLLNKNLFFYALSKKYFLQGLRQGYNKT